MPEIEVGRRSPYEEVFQAEGFDEEAFREIEEEARRSGADPTDRSQFSRVPPVSDLLERLLPHSFDTAALDSYLEILFHGFHFWRAGRPFYAIEDEVVRSLIERPPDLAGWTLALPHPALYIELPRHLFWAAVTDAPPEPAEGMFARAAGAGSIDILLVLGMRPDRPGFSAAALSAPADAPLALAEDAFRSDLPGAELAGLYSLGRSAEAVALLARLVWYLAEHPEVVRPMPAARVDSEGATRLPHSRVGPLSREGGRRE